eukprot:gene11235-11384_t
MLSKQHSLKYAHNLEISTAAAAERAWTTLKYPVAAGQNYTINMRVPKQQGNIINHERSTTMPESIHMLLLAKSLRLTVERYTPGQINALRAAAAGQAALPSDDAAATTASAVATDMPNPAGWQPADDHNKLVMQLHQMAASAGVKVSMAPTVADLHGLGASGKSFDKRQLQGALLRANTDPAATEQDDQVHSFGMLTGISDADAGPSADNTSKTAHGSGDVSHSHTNRKLQRVVPHERGQLHLSMPAADAVGGQDFSGLAAAETTATGRVIWGVSAAPTVRPLPVVPTASIAPASSSVAAAVHVTDDGDYPVPVISLPNQGVVSLMETTSLELDGSYSLGSDEDAIVSWSWALRMISPQEADLTASIDQVETEPIAAVSITVPGSYVVGLTVQAASGAAHYNNTALIVLSGSVMATPSGTGILPQSAWGASPPFPYRLRLRLPVPSIAASACSAMALAISPQASTSTPQAATSSLPTLPSQTPQTTTTSTTTAPAATPFPQATATTPSAQATTAVTQDLAQYPAGQYDPKTGQLAASQPAASQAPQLSMGMVGSATPYQSSYGLWPSASSYTGSLNQQISGINSKIPTGEPSIGVPGLLSGLLSKLRTAAPGQLDLAGSIHSSIANHGGAQPGHSRHLKQIDWTTDPAFTSFLTQNIINPALINSPTGSDAATLAALAGFDLGAAPTSATSAVMRANLPSVNSNNPSNQQSATTSGLGNPLRGLGSFLSGVGAALQGNSNRAGVASNIGTGFSSSTQYSNLAAAGPYSITGSGSYNSADGQMYSSSGALDADRYSQLSLAASGRPLGSAGTRAGLLQQGIQSAQGLAQSVQQQGVGSTISAWPSSSTALGSQQYIIPETSSAASQYQLGSFGYTPTTTPGYGIGGYSGLYNQAADSTNQQLGSSLSSTQYTVGPGSAGQYSAGQLSDATGQYSLQNANAQGIFDPTTGQFVGSPPGQGTVPGGYYWTGGYWGYCPPPSPPSAINFAPPPPPGATTGFVRSPQRESVWDTSPATGLAPVLLDATGTFAAPGRQIVAYGWVVKSAVDGSPRATATGITSTVQLPPGGYAVTLNVVDNTGGSDTDGPVQFAVRGPGLSGPGGIGPSSAVMMARITSPPVIVVTRAGGGNQSIPLDASGSSAGPGRQLQLYVWTVTNQQAGNMVVLYQQAVRQAVGGFVALPVGSYIVSLIVQDNAGRNASITQNFVVAGGTVNGTLAVIAQPLSFVEPSPGGLTTVLLDAQGSAAKLGATLTQLVWAVITLPGKQPVANGTGRVTQVRLPLGQFQIGLLVLDSSSANAVAVKDVLVGSVVPPPEDSGAGPPVAPDIPVLDAPLEAETGGRVNLPSITDPNGDPVSVTWDLRQGDRVVKSGAGAVISLANISPGLYTILITADDGSLTATGSYQLRVLGSPGSPAPGPKPPPGPPPLVLDLRLPSLALAQGCLLQIHAGSTGVPIRWIGNYTYSWRLLDKASGQVVIRKAGADVQMRLSEAGSFQLELKVADPTSSATATAVSNLKVLPLPSGSAALPTMAGTCGPFASVFTSSTLLTCPDSKVASASNAARPAADKNLQLVWAWRLTQLGGEGKLYTKVGATADFGKLPQGGYVVESAVGAGGPPTSTATIYFLSSYLVQQTIQA